MITTAIDQNAYKKWYPVVKFPYTMVSSWAWMEIDDGKFTDFPPLPRHSTDSGYVRIILLLQAIDAFWERSKDTLVKRSDLDTIYHIRSYDGYIERRYKYTVPLIDFTLTLRGRFICHRLSLYPHLKKNKKDVYS